MKMPETRYSRSADGVHIAYQVLGDGDLDIVLSLGFVSHLEHSWEDPAMARFLRRLASFSRLIVFDKRGTGMSDRTPDGRPGLLEDRVERHRHPDGHGGIGAGGDHGSVGDLRGGSPVRRSAPRANESSGRVRRVRRRGRQGSDLSVGAGSGSSSVARASGAGIGRRRMYLERFAPSLVGDKRYEDWFAKLERLSVSPGAAVALVRMLLEMDVRGILPAIRVPTLILHKRDDKVVPIDEGRHRRACPGREVRRAPVPTTGRGSATRRPSKRSRSSSPGCVTAPSRTGRWSR